MTTRRPEWIVLKNSSMSGVPGGQWAAGVGGCYLTGMFSGYHSGAVLTAVFWEVASNAWPFEGTCWLHTGVSVQNKGDMFLRDFVSHSLKDAVSHPGLPFEIISIGNLLKSSGHYTCHQFNIQQFYVLPTQCIYVFCVDLRTNSHYFPIQH